MEEDCKLCEFDLSQKDVAPILSITDRGVYV